ncbi:MAG: pathogenicity locus [Nitrospirae bacterium]|nr:pathogenicity locus [Nitrospirota bacterium]
MIKSIKSELLKIPGVGKSISLDLQDLGIKTIADLKDKNPEKLYEQSNKLKRVVQDRCLLYVFRCAVYFANHENPDPEKLKWWNWKDVKL